MTTLDTNIGFEKPPLLRVIFILNALKILLALGLQIGFKCFDLQVGSVSGPSAVTLIFWTMIGYIATFAAIVTSILKRSIIGLRGHRRRLFDFDPLEGTYWTCCRADRIGSELHTTGEDLLCLAFRVSELARPDQSPVAQLSSSRSQNW